MTDIYQEHVTSFNDYFSFKPLPFKGIDLTDKPIFNNVEANRYNIYTYLRKLSTPSGIYMFYLTDKPLHFYIGQSKDLPTRFLAHYNQAQKEISQSRHGKFYNYVNSYK